VQYAFSRGLALSGRADHASVWNGDADAGNDLCEGVVADAVVELLRIDVVSHADSRHADRVRTAAFVGFKVFGVHEDADEVILVIVQAEQNSQSNVVDAAFHCAVHSFSVVRVVVLRAGRVKDLIVFLIICLLEQDVGANAGVLQTLVVFYRRGCNVDIDSSDGTVFMLDVVDRVDGFQHVFNWVVDRVFAAFQSKTLVSHVLQGDNFAADLLLSQLLACDMLVLEMIRAVFAAVDAVIGKVQRRKHYNSVAVEILLDLLRQFVDFLIFVIKFAVEQDDGLLVADALAQAGLGKDLVDEFAVGFVGLTVCKAFLDFFIADKFFRLWRHYIIHIFTSFHIAGLALQYRRGSLRQIWSLAIELGFGAVLRPQGFGAVCYFLKTAAWG